MKDDKFVLIFTVCLIIFCKFWGLFVNPVTDSILTNTLSLTERQIDSVATAKETTKKDEQLFVGCSSGFSASKYTETIDGKMDVRYKARNTVSCDCLRNGSTVTKQVIYEYSYEPSDVEMDCNTRCKEICTK